MEKGGNDIMARTREPGEKNINGNYKSIADNADKFNKANYESILVRVKKGSKDLIIDYLERMSQEDPENPKYSSLNALVKALLEAETGIKLN